MSRYSAQADPIVDRTVESHLKKIVIAITSQMEPQSIILRGSFGRGEGSIILDKDLLTFLSDYEIDVATPSPFYRSTFAKLSAQLTTELGVETSIRWVRPDYLYASRIGPFPAGTAPITISLYESRYGSQTLFGRDIISASPNIDPQQIRLSSAHKLMLNRMAEALYYLPSSVGSEFSEMHILHWVNKVILACAESLLLLWGEYHFSYQERGNRFSALAPDRLDFMNDRGSLLLYLVAQATEFKLRPSRVLYPGAIQESWQRVAPICDSVFRHITKNFLGFSFVSYAEYPQHYLGFWSSSETPSSNKMSILAIKLLETYKYLRRRKIPKGILLPFRVSQVVYAIVPLMFNTWAVEPSFSAEIIREVRHYLNYVFWLEPCQTNLATESNLLRQQTLWAWKNFCYL